MAKFNFPASPLVGDTYQFNGFTWTFNGIGWVTSGNGGTATVVSATPPVNPADGIKWVNLNTGVEYTRVNDGVGSYWVEMATPGIQPNASETQKGSALIASQAEVNAGVDDSKFVTPKKLLTVLNIQTWQDVKVSRAAGSTYTNNTGREIKVSISVSSTVASNFTLAVSGIIVNGVGAAAGTLVNLIADVPNGATYGVTVAGGTPTIAYWTEKR